MTTLSLNGLVSAGEAPLPIAFHRKGAALIALLFPLLAAGIIIAALTKAAFDPTGFLEHPLFLVLLPSGCWAMVYWIRRYWNPACYALRSHVPPVVVTDRELLFFKNHYPLTHCARIHVEGGKIRFMDGPSVVAEHWPFFIKSARLQINLRNLG